MRTVFWSACLVAAVALCATWAALPTLEGFPQVRIALFAATGVAMLGLVFCFPNVSTRRAQILILAGAALLRVVLLPAPVSDDVHRYLWEARLVVAGENPYSAPADDPRWDAYRDADWDKLNHADRPTAYPPGAQLANAAAVAIWDSPYSFKALALGGDILTLLLLLAMLRRDQLPLRWAGLYAFNPVILIAFAAEAHFDSLMVAALLGTLYAAGRGHTHRAWIYLGLAVQVKFIALLLAPLLLTRATWRGLPAFALALGIPALAFANDIPGLISGLAGFAGNSAFNGPLFSLLSYAEIPAQAVRPITYTIFFAGFAAVFFARHLRGASLLSCAHASLTLLLLCSPIVHFWYLAWVLPLAALRPSFGWTTASIVTCAGYFLVWHTESTQGWWGYGHGTAALLWAPALLAFAAQHRQLPAHLYHRLRRKQPQPQATTVPEADATVGIVIPTLDPGPQLGLLVGGLRTTPPSPILLADASSPPTTFPDTTTIPCPRGRGDQIAAAASTLTSDWILVAHADTTPRPGWHADLLRAIHRHPEATLLVLGQRFDSTNPGTLLVEILNELRVVFGGVAFGDQTMVIRRDALADAGGFPAQPLMEDVEASLRLQARGRVLYLGQEWRVSATKWRGSFGRRFPAVVRLVASYQLARLRGPAAAQARARKQYAEYYP